MRRHPPAMLLAACALACAPAPTGLTPAQASAIRDSVGVALAAFRAQSAAGQWDSALTFYADDPNFRWVEEGKVVADSVADIRRGLFGLAPGLRVETVFTGLAIAPLAPGSASVVTGFTTTFADSSGPTFTFGGMMTVVMVDRGGRWQFLTGHSSTTRPAPQAP